jgi:hypothetical protein
MKLNAASATVLLLVAFAVLTTVSTYVQSVDPATIPSELTLVWQGLTYIFLTSSAAPLWVFVRNIYGYLGNKYGATSTERANISYEANQFYGSWLKYEGYIKALAIMILAFAQGTPLEVYAVHIAGSIAFLVDVIGKKISDLKTAPTST